ncbi:CinA family nicotinamide mononucleotide deamidase-related protein [Vibrio quintilis]|uniref:CinA-like protein n=1 Tax=Vibrio quintilis TaxID=1117707 RepID=A0A1M7YV00_9VIBR|nr:CinA family nicotinamide mononucleotide deamidase-related protein [Vibrio quintilis]SHO56408.1 NMN amidohydrolase-like protein YfaY [Vibrio quintilis]
MIKVTMLSTGEEVLHGDIQDTNSTWLSRLFFERGYALTKRSTAGDNRRVLREELLMLSLNSDILIVNGGLGPTGDDLSAEIAAEVSEQSLVLFPEWLDHMKSYFEARNLAMPQNNVKQAMLPEGAKILNNPIGTACGFKVEIHGCQCYFTPGVPREFKRMIEEVILPDIETNFTDVSSLACHRLYTMGGSESALEEKLNQVTLPQEYSLGFRSYLPFIEVKLFGPRGNEEAMYKLVEQLYMQVSDYTVSIDQPMLAQLSDKMQEQKKSLALAEQSTRGWLANWLFDDSEIYGLSGSSWVLSPKVSGKISTQDPLAAVLALASATKDKSATDLALATGSCQGNEFSVGLSTPEGEWAQKLKFSRQYAPEDQRMIIGTIAADMLLRYLSSKPVFGRYSSVTLEKQLYIPAHSL